MTSLTLTRSPTGAGRGAGSRTRGLAALIARVQTWVERRRQRRDLLALSDEMLKDIGITRAEAEGEGMKRPWQA